MSITFLKRKEIGRLGRRNFSLLMLPLRRIFSSIRFKFLQLTLCVTDISSSTCLKTITIKFFQLDIQEQERLLLLKTSSLDSKVLSQVLTSIFLLKLRQFKCKTLLKNSLKEEAKINGSQRMQRRNSFALLMT